MGRCSGQMVVDELEGVRWTAHTDDSETGGDDQHFVLLDWGRGRGGALDSVLEPSRRHRRQILCSSTFERQAPRAKLHTLILNRRDPLVRSRTGSMGVVIFGAEKTCCVVNRQYCVLEKENLAGPRRKREDEAHVAVHDV